MPTICTHSLPAIPPSSPSREGSRQLLTALALTAGLSLTAWAAEGPRVPVATAAIQAVGNALVLDGHIEAVQQSTLSAQASGRVLQLLVKAGDTVRSGQTLAVIDDRMTQAGVAQAQAGVAQAEAALSQAEQQQQRTQELRAQGFVSQAALDQVNAQLKAARAATQQARAAQTQSGLAQGHTRLIAPYAGHVLATHLQAGDLAAPGVPVLTLYAPKPLRAVVQVPLSRDGLARQSTAVQVELSSGRWVTPQRQTRLPAADPVAQTVEWRLDLSPQEGAETLPGQQTRVRFVSGEQQRLTLPASAILRRGELTAVYVARSAPAGFTLRAVRVGSDHGTGGVEILSGIKAGDQVALDPVRAGLAGAQPQ